MDPKKSRFTIYLLLLLFGAALIFGLERGQEGAATATISYSEFETYLEQGLVADVVVGPEEVRGTFTQPQDGHARFVAKRVDPDLAARLREHGAGYAGTAESGWLPMVLSWVVPVALLFAMWMFLFRRMGRGGAGGLGGMMSVGRSKARIYAETETKVSFDDVAGVDEAKEELYEIIEFLREPEHYGRLGAHMPKGILLVGPPGTGKTLLARAVAGEAGVPFFSISGSEFVEMFVGVGAARVRDLFEQARKRAPAIIFIDELDALGRARGAAGQVGGHEEREQTLNQLLAELDGFDPSQGLVLLAATNRPEILDPALLRAGRFDRQILVDRPDRAGRAKILQVHMRKVRLSPDLDPAAVAGLTTGFTGADLANLVNEAALLATRRESEAVTMEDFTRAIERIIAGLEKRNRLMNPVERRTVAYHEAGHALMALALPGMDRVHKISIIPRGVGALGYTIQRPTEDRFLMTAAELEGKIAVLLGGRAAERLVFGHFSTGAADDLAKVTDIARSMVTRYGMDEGLGHVAHDPERSSFLGAPEGGSYLTRRFSEATARQIDEAVKRIVDAAFARATATLEANRAVLERCAERLLETETLEAAELKELTADLIPARDAGPAGAEGGGRGQAASALGSRIT